MYALAQPIRVRAFIAACVICCSTILETLVLSCILQLVYHVSLWHHDTF